VSFEAESQRIVQDPASRKPSETVSGYLAALAIFVSVIGIFWHPLRLILPALVLALVSAGMAGGKRRLQQASVMIGGVSLFLGLALAVATSHALW
jgi:hypothetical protein